MTTIAYLSQVKFSEGTQEKKEKKLWQTYARLKARFCPPCA